MTLLQIREALRPHGLELALMPEIGNATAGSVACAGTKDSWLFPGPPSALGWPSHQASGFAQISSLVRSLRMVDAAGNDALVTDPARLHVLRSSYGLLGIIHEVTFEARKADILRSEYEWLRVSTDAVPPLNTVFGHAHAVLAFLQPYSGRLLVERRVPDPTGAIGPYDELKRGVRDFMWEWGASEATTLAEGLTALVRGTGDTGVLLPVLGEIPVVGGMANAFLAPFINGIAGRIASAVPPTPGVTTSDWLLSVFDKSVQPVFKAIGGFRGYRGDSMIDFQFDRPSYFDFTFWAFPVRRWQEIVAEYLAFCEQQKNTFRARLFTEIYFIARDQHALLSFSPDEPVFTLDMVDTYGIDDQERRDAWHGMSEQYNRWAAGKGGRPVLNQTKQIDRTPDVIKPPHGYGVFGPAWPTFQAAVAQADPQERFLNGFFAALL